MWQTVPHRDSIPDGNCRKNGCDQEVMSRFSPCISRRMLEEARAHRPQLDSDRRAGERRSTERRYRPAATVCPRCASGHISRSTTRLWERPMRWISPLVPFRCHTCKWRGWRRPEWLQVKHSQEPGLLQHQASRAS